jgi:hypothetical protein
LLLAVVAGSTIGFKIGLPGGSDASPLAVASPPASAAPALTFSPPGGRRAIPKSLVTARPPAPGLRPLSRVEAASVSLSLSRSLSQPGSTVGFNAPASGELRFMAVPSGSEGSAPIPPAPTQTAPAPPSGPPPDIQNVHTVSLSPFSATLAWRTSVPATARIAYGLDAPVLWTAATPSGTDHRATVAGLTPATSYVLVVIAKNGDGPASSSQFMLTTPQLSGSVRATTSGSTILLDGQPSFPKMVWAQCVDGVGSNLADGIDFFMGNGCGSAAQLAHWVSGRAYVLADAQASAEDRAGSVGTHLPDEWDTHLPGDLTFADAERLVPPIPGSGPRFLTLTNHFYSQAAPLPQGRGMYPALVSSADVLGFDLYPLQNWCRWESFHDVFDSQLDLVALARGRPTFQWIEARRMDCSSPELDPTPATVHAEAWLSIAAGAHAIGYFPNNWSADVGAEIARTNREIQTLVPALVEPNIAASVSLGSPIKVGAREHNGAIYVITVNTSRAPAAASFTVPALGNRVVQTLDGTQRVTVASGSFTAQLGGLEARIYIAAP